MVKDGSEYFKIYICIDSTRTLVVEMLLTEFTSRFETLYHTKKKLVRPFMEGSV